MKRELTCGNQKLGARKQVESRRAAFIFKFSKENGERRPYRVVVFFSVLDSRCIFKHVDQMVILVLPVNQHQLHTILSTQVYVVNLPIWDV